MNDKETKIALSNSYLLRARRIFPAYYTDQERLIVMIAKCRYDSHIDEFDSWLSFFNKTSEDKLVQFCLGITAMNFYLKDKADEELLHSAHNHFLRASLVDPDDDTTKALCYFVSYMREGTSQNCLKYILRKNKA